MNYLAHAYLSFKHPDILVGNMISDYVKGKQKLVFSDDIQKGIMLHRAIDAFTDMHPATKEAKQFFRPYYGLYAGAFMDIVYDHFLAKDNTIFKEDGLKIFAENTYQQLDQYVPVFPEKFARLFPYMKQHNWLYNYQFPQGIHNSFGGLVHRAAFLTQSAPAIHTFEEHYHSFHKYYLDFFPEIKTFAWQQFTTMFPEYNGQ